MFPASSAGSPAASARWWVSAAVVDLPLVPVTTITRSGPCSASHSEVAVVTGMPSSRSACISGRWIETPGERTTTSQPASASSSLGARDDPHTGAQQLLGDVPGGGSSKAATAISAPCTRSFS